MRALEVREEQEVRAIRVVVSDDDVAPPWAAYPIRVIRLQSRITQVPIAPGTKLAPPFAMKWPTGSQVVSFSVPQPMPLRSAGRTQVRCLESSRCCLGLRPGRKTTGKVDPIADVVRRTPNGWNGNSPSLATRYISENFPPNKSPVKPVDWSRRNAAYEDGRAFPPLDLLLPCSGVETVPMEPKAT